MEELKHKRVAILATHGFETPELTGPQQALIEAGAHVEVVSQRSGHIEGWTHDQRSGSVSVDRTLRSADAAIYDALLITGGLRSADRLRSDPKAVALVRAFFSAHKPVAAIGHGLQVLIEADVVRRRSLTSSPSIRTDLLNAGAYWTEAPVVVDEGLVTAASSEDLSPFHRKLVEEIWEGQHTGQTL